MCTTQLLEQIILRYIDLCVMLKKGREAKDGLIHYRNVCQQVSVSSLEEVIKYFLKSASDKAEEAQSQADMVRNLFACSLVFLVHFLVIAILFLGASLMTL